MFTKDIINEIGKKIHAECHNLFENDPFASKGNVKWSKIKATFKIGADFMLNKQQFNLLLKSLKKPIKDTIFIKAWMARYKKGSHNYMLTINYESVDKNGLSLKEINYNYFAETNKYKNIKKEWLNKTFQYQNRIYRVTGLYPSRTKYPISIYDIYSKHERIATTNFIIEGFKFLNF